MNKRNKWIASMLTMTMAGGMLAACSSNTDNSGGAKPGAAVADKSVNPSGMPIVNAPISLKFFTGKSATNGNKFEDTLVWKEYAKMSNMNVTFELVPFENLTEKKKSRSGRRRLSGCLLLCQIVCSRTIQIWKPRGIHQAERYDR